MPSSAWRSPRHWSSWGFAVVAAASAGPELLRAVEGAAPDVVLTELHMPRLDGYGVLQALATLPGPLPVVVMSAAYSPEVHDTLLRGGAAAALAKTARLEEVARVLHAVGAASS